VFLPISLVGFYLLTNQRLVFGAKLWLVLCNLFFYGFWNPVYLPLLLGSMLVNYVLGVELGHDRARLVLTRKRLLVIGIAFNLGALGYFKYTDFLVGNLNALAGSNYALPGIVLPLAISFFTFQQIAYLVDSYLGETTELDPLNYMIFVSFFPQLIAGPIVHHKEMLPQFRSMRNIRPKAKNIVAGLFIFSVGLFKKVVIADTFAIWATAGFDSGQVLDFWGAWATSLSYTFQLYFDFSGYCDMAIGAALFFNIRLPLNFNSPYKALDIQDFWRRWHITLGRFLRDYLYIPLGGNRVAEVGVYANLIVTFVLGGIWHGASWMFVIWGALHGIALAIHRLWHTLGFKMPAALAWLTTFVFIVVCWVFFRATTLDDALRILSGMVNISGAFGEASASFTTEQLSWGGTFLDKIMMFLPAGLAVYIMQFSAIGLALLITAQRNGVEMMDTGITTKKLACASLLFAAGLYASLIAKSSVFLYFNF
jgi:D-alanyl-lipoteichoic acid acyltransferase DltB (MBOAT superfamily)